MKTIETTVGFDAVLKNWLENCQRLVDDYRLLHYKNNPRETLDVANGKKYIKIVKNRAAWAFIDKVSGDIFKPASWAAPAKHARGNIFDESNGMKYMSAYGPDYLR